MNQHTGSEYTEKDCLTALRRAARELGKSPSGPEYTELGLKPGRSAIKRYCDGWNTAKEKAGLETWEGNPGYISVNDSYFHSINTPEKSYWLGFLYADGSVKDKYNTVSIQLQKEDENHLCKFSEDIDSGYKIQDIRTDTSHKCGIDVISEEMVSDLMEHGCVPNKTHKDTLPELEEGQKIPFIRGYFDGDGSFRVYEYSKRTHLRWVITSSSVERLETMLSWLKDEADISEKDVLDINDRSSFVQFSSKSDLLEIGETIYPDKMDTTPSLDRKRRDMVEWMREV